MITVQKQVRDEFEKKGEALVNEDQVTSDSYSRLESVFTSYKQQVLKGDSSGIKNWVVSRGSGFDIETFHLIQKVFDDEYTLKRESIRVGEAEILFPEAKP